MKSHIVPALRLTLVCLVFFSGLYTLAVWGGAQLLPHKGLGERLQQGEKYHYTNIGQEFNEDRYFWSRPSAVGYNAASSAGSNKGPANSDYLTVVQARIDTFLVHHPGISRSQVPADIVTASGSGLDPHISPQAARIQVARVARVRGVSAEKVEALVREHTEQPLLGIFGKARVNVLKLNIALDAL